MDVVVFNEDQSHVRKDNADKNMTLIRETINMLNYTKNLFKNKGLNDLWRQPNKRSTVQTGFFMGQLWGVPKDVLLMAPVFLENKDSGMLIVIESL